MSDFDIDDAGGFLRLSKALKEAGRGDLRKELNKRLKAAVKPVIAETRARARQTLPQGGGYAALVARAPQRVQVRTGQETAGVRVVVVRDKSSAARANRGVIRHPVFGHDVWVDQPVTPGWFDVPAEAAAPEVRKAVQAAMQSVVDDIVRGAR